MSVRSSRSAHRPGVDDLLRLLVYRAAALRAPFLSASVPFTASRFCSRRHPRRRENRNTGMNPSWLAPFRVRSFRYQWPADLVTAWAIEMETLILGWYVLVETGSVLTLTLF